MIFLKVNYKKLIKYIIVPLILGAIVGFLSGSSSGYKEMIKPSFAPKGIVFPIMWSILYILMGISRYLIDGFNRAEKIYNIQLILNLLWSFVFFTFKLYFVAFLWIIVLIICVIFMIREFLRIKASSGLIQIPYLLWLIFACILSFFVYMLN